MLDIKRRRFEKKDLWSIEISPRTEFGLIIS